MLLYNIFSFFVVLFFRGDYMKPLKEKISITIDSDIVEKLRLMAEKDDRSLSQYINLVLKEYLKNN
jgi:hypothetical protein